jgi:hypothetical protein
MIYTYIHGYKYIYISVSFKYKIIIWSKFKSRVNSRAKFVVS